jgi:hypothetical protein
MRITVLFRLSRQLPRQKEKIFDAGQGRTGKIRMTSKTMKMQILLNEVAYSLLPHNDAVMPLTKDICFKTEKPFHGNMPFGKIRPELRHERTMNILAEEDTMAFPLYHCNTRPRCMTRCVEEG